MISEQLILARHFESGMFVTIRGLVTAHDRNQNALHPMLIKAIVSTESFSSLRLPLPTTAVVLPGASAIEQDKTLELNI
jgi:hypothetical protein